MVQRYNFFGRRKNLPLSLCGHAWSAWAATEKSGCAQLALTMSISDFCNITEGGESANPAGNFLVYDGNIVFSGGTSTDSYITISLPKGYRFTGYEIVLANNIGEESVGDMDVVNQKKVFYEAKDLSYLAATTKMTYYNAFDYSKYADIKNAIEEGNDNYLAVASQSNGNYEMKASAESGEGNYYTISRTSKEAGDMGNHLYFRLSHEDQAYFCVRIISARLYFTAEGDFTEKVTPETKPTSITTTGANYMYAPFTTGKIDLGEIVEDEHGHNTYNYLNVRDLIANNIIFEEDAVTSGALPDTPGEGGVLAVYNNDDYYFGLKNNTTYYVESPITAPNEGGEDSPVGFRIVGAKVNYTYGTQHNAYTHTYQEPYTEYEEEGPYTDYVIYASSGGYRPTYYYLTTTGAGSSSGGQKVIWDGTYIRLASNNGVLYLTDTRTYSGGTRYAEFTDDKEKARELQLSQSYNGTYIYYTENETTYYLRYTGDAGFRFQNNTSNLANLARTSSGGTTTFSYPVTKYEEKSVSVPAFTPSSFTISVYDHTGQNVIHTKTVNSSADDGSFEIPNLNNDAIKFAISGLNGGQALVTVDLTMQALDPYIDQMTVVCTDPEAQTQTGTDEDGNPIYEALKITQGFTASDFSVSGGEFHFYLPDECDGHTVQISFEDLYSHYADDSYTQEKDGFNGDASRFSRYNFVKSDHYNAFGTTSNNIYNDYDEAADPQLERLKVSTVGSKAFKFNNAAEVSTGAADYFIEYPFSLEAYTAAGGEFDDLTFKVDGDDHKDTRYVFTTDETAYNIAPTKATQHRMYAFYEMNINVHSSTYEPKVRFVPVYKKGDTVSGTVYGNRQQDDFYGAIITAEDNDGKPGYAQTDKIFELIAKAINEDKQDSFGNTDIPDNADKLLYLDFSNLAGIFQVTTEQHGSMDDYSKTNAANCLVFLPVGASAPNNNVAYKLKSGSFKAAHDIVLTDKQPFYSPYDIQVDAANKAYYEREITVAGKGKVTSASIIMPFDILIDSEGKHTNVGDTKWAFSLHEMQAENCITDTDEDGKKADPAFVYFPALEGVKSTQPNHPYIVKVNEENVPEAGNISFICSQSGATIKATTSMGEDYTFLGSESTGTDPKDGSVFTFTSHGSYSGKLLPYDGYYYYFANNMFVRSNEYKYKSSIRVTPFRGYYSSEAAGAKVNLTGFDVIFGEGFGGQSDGIKAVETGTKVMDYDAPVYDLQGRKLANSLREANLGKGMYVINGMKIIVK